MLVAWTPKGEKWIRETFRRCSGAHLGTKRPCFYWRIWTDVEDSNSQRFLVIFCARHWRLGWWHFRLLTFLSHYFSCDCRLLALYSEGGERTTALAVGRGCSSQHKKCQEGSRHMPEPWPHQPHLGNCM
uniref:Uncharacterized protein n=1 Tax=Macaca fascicularis TaxID=9541 RepID=A0A7N9CGG7_MACFA